MRDIFGILILLLVIATQMTHMYLRRINVTED